MEKRQTSSGQQGTTPAIIAFFGVVLIIFVIALLNAPTMGGARVMASLQTYFAEVRATAIPFMIVYLLLGRLRKFGLINETANNS